MSTIISRLFSKWLGKQPSKNQWIADVAIAGLQHYRGNDLAELIQVGDTLELKEQPDNEHDKNAIIVMWHDNKIGYIPQSLTKEISRQLSSGVTINSVIIDIKPIRFGRKWIKVRLEAVT